MKFMSLVCLFFSSISTLAAPIGYSRSSAATAIASPAVVDELVTEVVTITIT
jgi:hypothetical protein